MSSQYGGICIDKKWITEGITESSVDWAKAFAEYLVRDDDQGKNPLNISQIRKFFGELKKIQATPEKKREDFILLHAKLAYAVGRDSKNNTKIVDFADALEEMIKVVDYAEQKQLNRLVMMVESIVAYHKYYGGK